MRVYRVEHMGLVNQHGHPAGPYAETTWFEAEHGHEDWWETDECNQDCVHDAINELCGDTSYNRPSPYSDGIGEYLDTDMLFCFPSVDMLERWFENDVYWLHANGYIVAAYEVETAYHGQHQTIFDWTTSKRVEEFSLIAPRKSLTRR